ncbi:MAG: histidine phosphatase family protein [Psychrilyobacter sp.]|uniref:histidine phosphatase family protein n=1 Tax=Psychrilyobacter sp. TaxID=2586924 RepID=UPI003C73CC00
MGKLILVRHGESEFNKENIFFGHLDPNLTEKGRDQALKTKKILSNIDYKEIYTSPLKRAAETAEIINIKNYDLNLVEELKELNFGILEGLTYEEILKKYPEAAIEWKENWQTYDYQTGESVEQLQERSVKFVESLDLSNGNIVAVCHWGVINCILSYYFSGELNGYWKFAPNYAGIIVIEFTDGYPILKGINIGDVDGII